MTDRTRAANMFAQLSRELQEETSEPPRLLAVCERAVEVVPSADFASLTLRRRRHRLETIAATHEDANRCDQLQYELGEGPCLDAVWHDDYYLAGDIRLDSRWPVWGPHVSQFDIGSLLAIRLGTSTESLGALNLYARKPHAFDPDDVDLALIFAVHAGNALSSAQLVSGLQTAMQTRHLIGVAQGVLMSKYDLDLDQAFEVLRRYSSTENVKLREVADFVVEHRNLPDLGTPTDQRM